VRNLEGDGADEPKRLGDNHRARIDAAAWPPSSRRVAASAACVPRAWARVGPKTRPCRLERLERPSVKQRKRGRALTAGVAGDRNVATADPAGLSS
jgi:hypothetical protein